jgi:TetR/AcrR family transcriptional regulator, regulator of autoinduction and epiphytic fitness
MNAVRPLKPSFREQVLQAREDAIVEAVNRLLADKGFDAMTVDAVAAEVGIAKASLYKHFESKEALAAAAMVRVLDGAIAFCQSVNEKLAPLDKLKTVVRWTYEQQLAGAMPTLPAQSSSLRGALAADRAYLDRLLTLSDLLGAWIEAAQQAGRLQPALPPELLLYTLFARACDPVLGVLRAGGNYSDAQLVDWLVATCFDGLATPARGRKA